MVCDTHRDVVKVVVSPVDDDAEDGAIQNDGNEKDQHHSDLHTGGSASRHTPTEHLTQSTASVLPEVRPTMTTITMQPVMILLTRVFSGKYGSSAPVTGFLTVIGAMAVNSGRGRSCYGLMSTTVNNFKHTESVIVRQTGVTAQHLNPLKLRAVPAVSQSGTSPLPVLQEGDGPQRHEDAEEQGSSIIKHQTHLQHKWILRRTRKSTVSARKTTNKKTYPTLYVTQMLE